MGDTPMSRRAAVRSLTDRDAGEDRWGRALVGQLLEQEAAYAAAVLLFGPHPQGPTVGVQRGTGGGWGPLVGGGLQSRPAGVSGVPGGRWPVTVGL